MTKIGIMSDSHDNLVAIDNALKIFKNAKVDLIFHCGDIIAPFALKKLLTVDIPLRIVFGNNDGERKVNQQIIKEHPEHQLAELVLIERIDNKNIAMTHGHVIEIKDLLLQSSDFDLVLTGHTHQRLKESRNDGGQHVNPGETCGWVTGKASVAIIELDTMDVQFIDFPHLET